MILAEINADSTTATVMGLLAGLATVLIKWFTVDIKDRREEKRSSQVREGNLVEQTELLRDLVKEKRRANKRSRRAHKETHRLLNKLMTNDKPLI